MKTYKGIITNLKDNQVFVYGQNTQYRNGKGSALQAMKFGAKNGKGGAVGKTYGIVTKDLTKKNHPSIPANNIIKEIKELYNFAIKYYNLEFLVAYNGKGINLCGYTSKELAIMFSSFDIPANVIFEEEFTKLLILHKEEKYNKNRFDEAIETKETYLCNFYQLDIPIIDEYNNIYWNSEGYYMSQRTNNLLIKSEIAIMSKNGGSYSGKARKIYTLDLDENNRIEYMSRAIELKFNNNKELKYKLLTTYSSEIIEKNTWNDKLFGVSEYDLIGCNMLGKLLMEYRNKNLKLILVLNNSESAPNGALDIDVTSRSRTWSRGLSPFILKGGKTWTGDFAETVEGLWQFSKIYSCHVDENNEPNSDWIKWAKSGWKTKMGIRYPMGKNAKPLYSYWNGKKYDYIEAKESLYIKMYFRSVRKTEAYQKLEILYKECLKNNTILVLRDFDAYNHINLKLSPYEVVKNEKKKFGHGFVLMFMLLGLLDDRGNFIKEIKKEIKFFE